MRTVNRLQKPEVGVHVHGEGREVPTRPDLRTLVHSAVLASSQVPVKRSITKASFFVTASMRRKVESSCTLISSRTAPADRRKGPASLGADRTSTIRPSPAPGTVAILSRIFTKYRCETCYDCHVQHHSFCTCELRNKPVVTVSPEEGRIGEWWLNNQYVGTRMSKSTLPWASPCSEMEAAVQS